MSGVRVRFSRPAPLGPDASLALEDFARAAASAPASVDLDETARVIGLTFDSPTDPPAAVAQDIERFFDSLASDSADRLGWS